MSRMRGRATAAAEPPGRGALLRRKCACGGSAHSCEDCRRQLSTLRHCAASVSESAPAPRVVCDVLGSPGRPLDDASRAYFEPRFGHDLSQVRIHADAQAARSAEAVNALAYTIGRDVVFAEGHYRPETSAGKQLLAHELTHVVQQSGGRRGGVLGSPESAEAEAKRVGSRAAGSGAARVSSFVRAGTVQRQEKENPLDEKAKAIIAKAKDKRPIEERGVSLVNDILTTYYAAEKAKVDAVEFNDAEAGNGLKTQSVGSGAGATGKIFVGTEFTKNVDAFARRVLQVGHELIHIDQYRGGKLAGKGNKDKREFLAHQQQALAAEIAGTGKVSYATRLNMIDGALGYYYCLSDADQKEKEFADKKDQLLKRRAQVDGKAGNDPVPEPKTCKRAE